MKTPAYSETAAIEASRRTLLAPGWIDGAIIREAAERPNARGNGEHIELVIAVPDSRGGERLFKDWLSSMPLGALRLRHASESIGKLDGYSSGEISASDFVGHTVRVKIDVEKKRGYAPRNVITDYGKSEARVSLSEVAS